MDLFSWSFFTDLNNEIKSLTKTYDLTVFEDIDLPIGGLKSRFCKLVIILQIHAPL